MLMQSVSIESEDHIVSTVAELCQSAADLVIMDKSDMVMASDLVKVIKTRAKEFEDERTRLVKPFNDGVKAINARFKAMTQPLDAAEKEIKAAMLAWQQAENRKTGSRAYRRAGSRSSGREPPAGSATPNSDGSASNPFADGLRGNGKRQHREEGMAVRSHRHCGVGCCPP